MPKPTLYATPEEKRKASAEKSRRWRERNPEKAKQAKRRWADKNPNYNSEYSKEYYSKNTEKVKEMHAAWRAENSEHRRRKDRSRFDANPEYYWNKLRKWIEANPEKVAAAKRRRAERWRLANPEKRCAMETRRRAQMLRAYPAWADNDIITQLYELARLRSQLTGILWEVDHIVPLNSDLVCGLHCGLHCEANLQVIPANTNLAKGNRWWPDMPGDVELQPFAQAPALYLEVRPVPQHR